MTSSSSDPPPISASTPLSELTDQQILSLTQSIKDSHSHNQPLVDEKKPLSTLRQEYQGEGGYETFIKKIRWLENEGGWKEIRRFRGDGDCFYRAFSHLLLSSLLSLPPSSPLLPKFNSHITSLIPLLQTSGNFSPDITQDFYQPLRDLISRICSPDSESTKDLIRETERSYNLAQNSLPSSRPSHEDLLKALNDPETSNSIVVFLRLLTSAFLKSKQDEYAPFLFALEGEDPRFFEGGVPTMEQFCSFWVESVNKEADHLQISALSRCLRISLSVAYLDQSSSSTSQAALLASATQSQSHTETSGGGDDEMLKVDIHRFEGVEGTPEAGSGIMQPGGGMVQNLMNWEVGGMILLYRPGHYDALYK